MIIKQTTVAFADPQMNNEIIKKLWNGFCLKSSEIEFAKGERFTFRIGEIELPALPCDKDYALCIEENGAAIIGKDYSGLMRGFMSLLMKIEWEEQTPHLRPRAEESNYRISKRMIHICIFPENDLYFIKKLIRLSALCQYTHIVLEFWGMLQFDCLKELAWPQAFTKEQAKELAKECHALGIEPIPMFNHLGHASAGRISYGKHVVLDQNPRLQYLFTPDGWVWNIESEQVKALLKQVRTELYEVFGKGEYIHLGCDEAFYISRNKDLRQKLPTYLKELTEEVEKEGRRPMIWMDMLLEKGIDANSEATGEKEEVVQLRNATAPSTVFVDWEYDGLEAPIPSLLSLKGCGKEILGAPWFKPANYAAHIETVCQNDLGGIMLTTWHTLNEELRTILGCAKKCGASTFPWSEFSGLREETASLMRRISFEGNAYADCGWTKTQI